MTNPQHIGREVRRFASLDSTNAYAATLVDDPASHGIVILAGEQTAGRGQYGRLWRAPAGTSVLMSVVLFPPAELRRPALITAWAAVAVADTLTQISGCEPQIKWPNDVLLNGRKVCGILIEQSEAVIAGIGLNVSQSAEDFERAGLPAAGSLRSVLGRTLDPVSVAEDLIEHLDAGYEALVRGELADLEVRWRSRLGLLGKPVSVEFHDGDSRRGRLIELGFDGLVLQSSDIVGRLMPETVRRITAESSA